MVRFVLSPDGEAVPDISCKLPGRGMWVQASRAAVEEAVKRQLFRKASAGKAHKTRADLPELVESLLKQRILQLLGLARRQGAILLGFDQVAEAGRNGTAKLVLSAADASADGKAKLSRLARDGAERIEMLTVEDFSFALGRDNVVHSAITEAGLAAKVAEEARRYLRYTGKKDA